MKIFNHYMKAYSIKLICALLFQLVASQLFAGWENPYTDRVIPYVPNSNSQQFQVGDKMHVLDASSTTGYLYKNIVSKIILGVDKDFSGVFTSPYSPNTAYTLVVEIEIDYKEWNGSTLTNHNNVPKTLRITYDAERGIIENENNILTLENALDIEATIISIKNAAGSNITVPDNVYLDGFIQSERYKTLSLSLYPSLSYTATPLAADKESRLITISSQPDGTENIDLEWLYLDWESGKPGGSGIRYFEYDFRHDGTRVNIKSGAYTLPAIYAKGVIIMRVRSNGFNTSNMNVWLNGNWSVSVLDEQGILKYNSSSGFTNNLSNNAIDGFMIEGFANGYNWQHATAFAEEGKRKQVISYFDGALYNRQTLTRNTTDNTVIVAQTIYDFNGRPAINVLPVPIPSTNSNDHSLLFKPDFNKSNATSQQYDYTDFDLDVPDNCSVTETNRMKNTSGAEKYYSSINPYTDKNTDYIPTSYGYPFTQVEYTSDGTGRIRRQSGIGPVHRLSGLDDASSMKEGKETEYFYLKPKQEELDRLFGNEVGIAEHYKKNIVIDANGQASVSYLDPMGRVIATALAGENPEHAPGILPIPSQATASTNLKVKLLNGGTADAYKNNGSAPEFYKTWGQVNLDENSLYKLNYLFAVPRYYAGECYEVACYDCRYILSVSIKNSCGEEMLPPELQEVEVGLDDKPLENVTDCNDSIRFISGTSPVDFYLDKGEYRIERTLSMKNSAIESFADHYMANNTCLKTFEELVEEEKVKLNYDHCNYTCEQCSTEVEAANDNNEYASPEEYEAALTECQQYCHTPNPCDMLMIQMKLDMSPGGQYFSKQTTPPSGNNMDFDLNNDKIPESNDYSWLVDFDIIAPTLLDDFNIAHSTEFSDWGEVEKGWKDEYAEYLVVYHPEYCMWEACIAIKSSYDYDALLEATEEHTEALTNGYYNPLDMVVPGYPSVSGGIDPFFDPGPGNKTEMTTSMSEYTTHESLDYSMWLLVDKTLSEIGSTAGCLSDYGWKTFRALYFAKKQEYLKSYYDNYKTTNSCGTVMSGYQQRFFYNPSDVNDPSGVMTTSEATAKSNAEAGILDGCNTTCESYRDKWKQELAACKYFKASPDPDYSLTTIEAILDDLKDVCMAGCDENNPFGSRNFPDGLTSPPTYSNFKEVLKGYLIHDDLYCDDILITWPMEYNHDYFATTSAYADTCACNINKGVYREAEKCLEEEAPGVSEDCACDIEDPAKRQAALMTLDIPETQKCVNCIDCYQLNEALFAFMQKYPYDAEALELMLPDEQNDRVLAWQTKLTVFLNLRFKFNLTLEDYMLHATQCQGRDEDATSIKDIIDFGIHDLITRKNHSYKLPKKEGESEVSNMREFKMETPLFMQDRPWYAQSENDVAPKNYKSKILDIERKTLFTYLETGKTNGPNANGYNQINKPTSTAEVAACECSKILNMKYAVDKGFIHPSGTNNYQEAYEDFYGSTLPNFNLMLSECCDWFARTKIDNGMSPGPMPAYPPPVGNLIIGCDLTGPLDPTLAVTNFKPTIATGHTLAYPTITSFIGGSIESCSTSVDPCVYEEVTLDLCGCDKLKKALDDAGYDYADITLGSPEAGLMMDKLSDLYGNNVDFETNGFSENEMIAALELCFRMYKDYVVSEREDGTFVDDFNDPNLTPPYTDWGPFDIKSNQLNVSADHGKVKIPRILSCKPKCIEEDDVYCEPCDGGGGGCINPPCNVDPEPSCTPNTCEEILSYFNDYVDANIASFPSFANSTHFHNVFNGQFGNIFDFIFNVKMENAGSGINSLNVPSEFTDFFPFDMEDMLDYFSSRAITDGKCDPFDINNTSLAWHFYTKCGNFKESDFYNPNTVTPCSDPCYYSENDILPNVLEWINQINDNQLYTKRVSYYFNVRDMYEYKDISTITIPDVTPMIKQTIIVNNIPYFKIEVSKGTTVMNTLSLEFPYYHRRFNWEKIIKFNSISYWYGHKCSGITPMFIVNATIEIPADYMSSAYHPRYNSIDGTYYEDVFLTGFLTPSITTDLELVDCPECIKLCNRPIIPQVEVPDPCVIALDKIAYYNAAQRYEEQNKATRDEFKSNYVSACSQFFEYLDLEFQEKEYHYTLYTYDQADNLVKTVPPSAVNRLDVSTGWNNNIKSYRKNGSGSRVEPIHNENLITWYRYNTLNQVIEQHTPDGGTSHFWYDKLGRIVLSQNAKQAAATNKYSYSLYDDRGRAFESGELSCSLSFSHDDVADETWLNTNVVANTVKTQITRAVYDDGSMAVGFGLSNANNYVLNRIGSNRYFETYDADIDNYTYATHYSYDIHGNVEELLQHIPELETRFANGFGFKRTKYAYDLISGNALSIAYQDGENDRFYHHYEYDADNRLIQAHTARKTDIWHQDTRINAPYFGVQTGWDRDAVYHYYRHGPLMRTELGQNQVQGMDYTYTLHGWLKSVNAGMMTAERDPGKDAFYTYGGNPNVYFGSDAMSFELTYFHDANDVSKTDYTGIGLNSGNTHLSDMAGSSFEGAIFNLYNGNISAMTTSLPVGSQVAATGHYKDLFKASPMGRAFRYDQLNRIRDVKSFSGLCADIPNNLWQSIGGDLDKWRETFTYDADGNIENANRYAEVGHIDSLVYNYHSVSGKRKSNRLYGVNEISPGSMATYNGDIENMSTFDNTLGTINTANNYGYDEIGNLIRDDAEGITNIEWNVQGKIKKITMASKADIEFAYDASGQRILKRVIPKTGYDVLETWYSRDASGNMMATYTVEQASIGTGIVSQTVKVQEFHIYGSSRIGMIQENSKLIEISLDITDPEEPDMLTTTGQLDLYVDEDVDTVSRYVGYKRYQLNNHLGNVLTVVTDRKIAVDMGSNQCDYYLPDVYSISDYYAFGMAIQERNMGSPKHTSDDCTSTTSVDSSVIIDDFSAWNSTTRNGWTNTTGGSINPTYVSSTHMRTVCGSTNYTYHDYSVVACPPPPLFGPPPPPCPTTYTYTFDAAAASSAHNFRIEVWDNSIMIASCTTTLGSTAWQTYTLSFTPTTTNIQIRITKVTTTANSILFIDNIILKEFTTTTNTTCTPIWTYPTGLKGYRFGFNGQEKDDEISGEANSYTAEFWQYDPRLGRRFNLDPVVAIWESVYAVFRDNPIQNSDPNGDSPGDPPTGAGRIGLIIGTHSIGVMVSLEGSLNYKHFSAAGGLGGVAYFKYNNTGKGGLEMRASLMIGYNSGESTYEIGTNIFRGSGGMAKFSQRTGIFNFQHGNFKASYENDGFPFAFGQKGISKWAGNGNDGFRTAAVTIGWGDLGIGFNLFTGLRKNYRKDEDKLDVNEPGDFGTNYPNGFVTESGTPYRMGAAFAYYKGIRLGIDSDKWIRHKIQDLVAHNIKLKVLGIKLLDTKQPGFKTYSDSIDPYVQINTSEFYNPFTANKKKTLFSHY